MARPVPIVLNETLDALTDNVADALGNAHRIATMIERHGLAEPVDNRRMSQVMAIGAAFTELARVLAAAGAIADLATENARLRETTKGT